MVSRDERFRLTGPVNLQEALGDAGDEKRDEKKTRPRRHRDSGRIDGEGRSAITGENTVGRLPGPEGGSGEQVSTRELNVGKLDVIDGEGREGGADWVDE